MHSRRWRRLISAWWGGCLGLASLLPLRAGDELSVTFTPAFVSHYMDRGVRLGDAAFQPDIAVVGQRFVAGLWSNFPLADSPEDRSDIELDFYVATPLQLSESMTLVPTVSWYHYPDADLSAGSYRNAIEPSLGLEWSLGGVLITPRFYYDFMLDGPTWELNAAYALALPALGTELNFAATLGTFTWHDAVRDAEPRVTNRGDYWLVGVSVPFTFSTRSTITLGVAYAEGFNNTYEQVGAPREKEPNAVGRVVVTLSYAITF